MTDEVAWLVEKQDPKNPGCVCNQFLGFTGDRTYGGHFAWHDTVQWAIRFARREDAERFVQALTKLYDALPHGKTLAGLRSGDPTPIIADHLWTDATGSPDGR